MYLLPKKRFFHRKGFTIIELLVVVSIIGMMSSIVLVALKNTKDKAIDSKVAQEMTNMRNVGALYYSNNGNKYSTVGAPVNGVDCSSAISANNNIFVSTDAQKIINDAAAALGVTVANFSCSYAQQSWALLSAPLKIQPPAPSPPPIVSSKWCVDSTNKTGVNFYDAIGPGYCI